VKYAALAGRQLFSMIFIISSAGHLTPQTIAWAASHHVPLPEMLVPVSGLMALVGGVSVLLGLQTRFGAWLLVGFLLPVTMVMHNFWTVADPATSQIEKAMFIKNVALLGGALFIGYFGPGPLSLDGLMKRESADRANQTTPVHSIETAPAPAPACVDNLSAKTTRAVPRVPSPPGNNGKAGRVSQEGGRYARRLNTLS